MEHYTGFYILDVAISKTGRLGDPIDRFEKVIAKQVKRYGEWDECLFPPGRPNGIFPGWRRGEHYVLSPNDMVKKT